MQKKTNKHTFENMANQEFMLDHVVWPRGIPAIFEEQHITDNEKYMLSKFTKWMKLLKTPFVEQNDWQFLVRMFERWTMFQTPFALTQSDIRDTLEGMREGDVFPMMLRAQNAALVITLESNEFIVYAFEISFKAETVNKANGSLRCSYPGYVVAVPKSTLLEEDFIVNFAKQLRDLFHQVKSMPLIHKAGVATGETRDTPNTEYVTEWIIQVLGAVGRHVDDFKRITKTVRDDVLWSTGLPNRRSSLWTTIKVVLHLTLVNRLGDELGAQLYKLIMLESLVQLGRFHSDMDLKLQLIRKISIRMKKISQLDPKLDTGSIFQRASDLCHKVHIELNGLCPENTSNPKATSAPAILPSCIFSTEELETRIKEIEVESNANQRVCIPTQSDFKLWKFENSIESHSSSQDLFQHAIEYMNSAESEYNNNPVHMSCMFLALFETWKRLDEIACQQFPMLLDYKTGINMDVFNQLLLPLRDQMERLRNIEIYVATREKARNPPLYSQSASFAVRYCKENANRMAQLRQEIENRSEDLKQQKIHEYNSVMSRCQGCSCTSYYRCNSCYAKRQELAVFEQLLPTCETQISQILFELEMPDCLAYLRDFTHLLVSKCTKSDIQPSRLYWMQTVRSLSFYSAWFKGKQQFCILGTTVKPFLLSHYSHATVYGSYISNFLKPHGCKYQLYIATSYSEIFQHSELDISRFCTLQLTEAKYSSLQWTVNSTDHTENQVSAAQSKCPDDMSLSEYTDFGTLRCGHRIQWSNISAVLESASLSMNTSSVFSLICQSIWQTERNKSTSWKRDAHSQLSTNNDFCNRFVPILKGILDRYADNWSEINVIHLVTVVCCRVIVLEDSQELKDQASQVLYQVRKVLFKWISTLNDNLPHATGSEYTKLCMKMGQIAGCGILTFNVDEADLNTVMCQRTDESLTQYLHFLSRFFDNLVLSDKIVENLDVFEKNMTRVCQRTALRLSHNIRKLLVTRQELLHDFYCSQWAEGNNANFGTTSFAEDCIVHTSIREMGIILTFNICTGQFLINGESVSRLPNHILEHEDFRRTYQSSVVFNVQPGGSPGAKISTHRYHGAHLRFSMVNRLLRVDELYADRSRFMLIPSSWLSNLFPKLLINRYTHWLDLKTRVIEFRPIDLPLKERSHNYVFNLKDKKLTEVFNQRRTLVNPRSDYFHSITENIFERLELTEYIHVFEDSTNNEMTIDLPRMNLHFLVNKSMEIESREYEGMTVTDHNIGTLLHLQNTLVLSSENSKIVLVPHGTILRNRQQQVVIDQDNLFDPPFFKYHVDLHQLQGPTTTEGWLMLAALHGYTSQLFPDPFTSMTGLETALKLLLTRCRSTVAYSSEANRIIDNICKLSPKRAYYPERYKCMQMVTWPENIHFTLASDAYVLVCDRLRKHSIKMQRLSGFDTTGVLPKEQDLSLYIKGYWRDVSPEQSMILKEMEEDIGGYPADTIYRARHAIPNPGVYELTRRILRNDFNYASSWGDELETQLFTAPTTDPCEKSNWLWLYEEALSSTPRQRLFRYTNLVMKSDHTISLIHSLAMVAANQDSFRRIHRPFISTTQYNYGEGKNFKENLILSIVKSEVDNRDFLTHQEKENTILQRMSQLRQWFTTKRKSAIYISDVQTVERMFSVWWQNEKISDFFVNISSTLRSLYSTKRSYCYIFLESYECIAYKRTDIKAIHYTLAKPLVDEQSLMQQVKTLPNRSSIDLAIFPQLSGNKVEEFFRSDLETSVQCMKKKALSWVDIDIQDDVEQNLERKLSVVSQEQEKILSELRGAWTNIQNKSCTHSALVHSYLWPKFSVVRLFEIISSQDRNPESPLYKKIVHYGILVTQYQRLMRCKRYLHNNDMSNLKKELYTEGHTNWDPYEFPEWLVLEIESNCMIREVQAKIALKLLRSDHNRVTQLNMGEGKTSVIVPLLALAISNGDSIARVVVLKQLYSVAYESLSFKLGGILNRQVIRIPFQRDISTDIGLLEDVYRKCKMERSVILSLPEYILSFYLMGLEKSYAKDKQAQSYLKLQKLTENYVRDILDESDELLHVKYQLIYTLGAQLHPDGEHTRWTVIQSILKLVKYHANKLVQKFPNNVEYSKQVELGSFPKLRIIEQSDELSQFLKYEIMNSIVNRECGVTLILLQGAQEKKLVTEFVVEDCIDGSLITEVKKLLYDENTYKTLLILRGMLGCDSLLFSLSRRWRVNYGVGSKRRMAVPFRAKDVASDRTEYGHCDVSITLTQLSYYYSGLSLAQLREAFELLSKSSHPVEEYKLWVDHSGIDCLPESLREFPGVNTQDHYQMKEILYPVLHKNSHVIDFWLNSTVFPTECKQFEEKVVSSSWDLAKKKKHTTIGFSGTNDTQLLLPLTIEQKDFKELKGTNAMVVQYLLQKENKNYSSLESNVTGADILSAIKEQILLDPGALILDLSNEQVATRWLELRQDVQAAVYFDERDRLVVRDRKCMRVELLEISPYKNRLKDCVIYLDDAHCRGTDLKFPPNARAAVTLGKGMTKDKFVQACMRLRLLGHGQSVHFYAADEVHRSILCSSACTQPTTEAVLRWAYNNTKNMVEDGLMMFAMQGLAYYCRKDAIIDDETNETTTVTDSCYEQDRLLLDQLYGRSRSVNTVGNIVSHQRLVLSKETNDPLQYLQNTLEIVNHCSKYTGTLTRYAHMMEEEQERELEAEKEDERQVQRPNPAKPVQPTYTLNDPYLSLADDLEKTTISLPLREQVWDGEKIQCTQDFTRVVMDTVGHTDDFLRPVRYFYYTNHQPKIVLMSMFEANEYLSKPCSYGVLCMFVPKRRPNQRDFSVLHVGRFHSPNDVPSTSLLDDLSLVAGSSYFNNMEECERIINRLGLCPTPRDASAERYFTNKKISLSGFVSSSGVRQQLGIMGCKVSTDPVPFLQKYILARTRNDGLMVSPMGEILYKGQKPTNLPYLTEE